MCRMGRTLLVFLLSLTVTSRWGCEAAEECQYSWQNKCGDLCHDKSWANCTCGPHHNQTTLTFEENDVYCCADSCETELRGPPTNVTDVRCDTGQVISKSERCDKSSNKCYNDYETSLFLGPTGHYTCPFSQECLPVLQMCQGVSCSNSGVAECDRGLRCSNHNTNIAHLATPIVR